MRRILTGLILMTVILISLSTRSEGQDRSNDSSTQLALNSTKAKIHEAIGLPYQSGPVNMSQIPAVEGTSLLISPQRIFMEFYKRPGEVIVVYYGSGDKPFLIHYDFGTIISPSGVKYPAYDRKFVELILAANKASGSWKDNGSNAYISTSPLGDHGACINARNGELRELAVYDYGQLDKMK